MCGITGYFSKNKRINCKKFYKAHKLIYHRGPDDEGFVLKNNSKLITVRGDDTVKVFKNLPHITDFENSSLILGHRRLSIIDLSEAGHQPFSYKNLHMVYNGEVYNYLELKKELEELGYSFKTKTDTEVVLIAFYEWGYKAFNKFNGMWALAIYDDRKDELILSRDRFGIKPLFYYKNNEEFYFASEIKVLLEFLDKRIVNKEMAIDYLKNNIYFILKKLYLKIFFKYCLLIIIF
jgi:asparagine synthase (glutamine-hydrolysing)